MNKFEQEVKLGEHFQCGKNWKSFLSVLNEERITEADKDIFSFYRERNFILKNLITCGGRLGNNQFLFTKE